MTKEADSYFKKTGEYTRWSNSMFSGMPTYLIYGGGKAGLVDYFNALLRFFNGNSLGYFNFFLITSYMGFIFLGVGPWLALLGALATGFSATHIGVLEAAHNGKLASSALTVMALAGIYRIFKKEYLIGGLAFTLALTLSLSCVHPQMTYYFLLACGVSALPFIYFFIRQKEWKELRNVILILSFGTIAALGANLYQTITVRSFSEDTMRGGSILSPIANRGQVAHLSESSQGGLGFEYAMQWSDGWRDLLAFLIPGAVGGSNIEKVGKNKGIAKVLKESGFQPQPFLPLYWGNLTFTGSPDYVGIIIVLLFVMGLFLVKGPLKWGMGLATLLLILMSLGKNFEIFNRFLFDYLPFLNKFRTPNSIHNVSSCVIVSFAVFSLYQLIRVQDKKAISSLLIKTTGALISIIVIFGFMGSLFYDFTSQGDSRYDPALVSALKSARAVYLNQDSIRSLVFLLIGAGLIYRFISGKLKESYLLLSLTLFIFIDLFGIARRYLSLDDWKPKSSIATGNPLRPVDQQILQDPQLYYRVLDLTGDPFQDASASFYHKSVGGYHPAKLRRYQDVIDTYLAKGEQKMINMLNTKYVINQNQQSQLNPAAMGNAWFISKIMKVNTPDEEIAAIENIDPVQTAVVLDKEFPGYLSSTEYTGVGKITLNKYESNALTYSSQTEGDQFAVFSEIWYGPDKGWQAYVDGQKMPHIRVNYLFRGLKVPPGNHTIEFKFQPVTVLRSIETGFWLNNLAGLMLIFLTGWILYKDFRLNPVASHVKPNPLPAKPVSDPRLKTNKKK